MMLLNYLIVFAAAYLIFIVALLAAYVWWRLPGRLRLRVVLQAVLGIALAYVLAKIAGAIHPDVRPFAAQHFAPLVPSATDNGFPSDHTTFAMLAALTILPYAKRWGIALAVLAFIVGIGRVGAGVHSWQDIFGGVAVAAIAAASAYYGVKWFSSKKIPTSQKKNRT